MYISYNEEIGLAIQLCNIPFIYKSGANINTKSCYNSQRGSLVFVWDSSILSERESEEFLHDKVYERERERESPLISVMNRPTDLPVCRDGPMVFYLLSLLSPYWPIYKGRKYATQTNTHSLWLSTVKVKSMLCKKSEGVLGTGHDANRETT